MAERHREAVQRQIHTDWANREYVEVITNSIKRIADFLNSFGECFHFFSQHPEHNFARFLSSRQ